MNMHETLVHTGLAVTCEMYRAERDSGNAVSAAVGVH